MLCNRCGTENTDGLRFCQTCGHKLQSRRDEDGEPEQAGLERPTDPAPLRLRDGRVPSTGPHYLEGWAYALALPLAVYSLLEFGVFWGLYLLAPLVYWLLRRRRM